MKLTPTEKQERFEKIISEVENILQQNQTIEEKLQRICELLEKRIPYYNWVGFYLVDAKEPEMLVLGPFVGEPTEHTRIPFGRGICGQAAERKQTFVVQDVRQENNYLSCSIHVQSEIVVPIFKEGQVIGELDIDSHELAPFSSEDRFYLEKICTMLAPYLANPLGSND